MTNDSLLQAGATDAPFSAEASRRQLNPLDPAVHLDFVDGMRAVAILAVVAFHVGLPGVSGGFVGVDVFFVISGFLIIGQIRAGLEAGRFTFFEFYARRTLRILPPFLLVLAVSLVVAPLVFTAPKEFDDFIVASVFAPIFLSNIYFNARQGYFDLDAGVKPLLHTWTLSVEEQFYLVTPILLFVLFRGGGKRFGSLTVATTVPLLLLSFSGSVLLSGEDGNAFYLAPWRAWEFIAGGLAGALSLRVPHRLGRAGLEALAAVGLISVLAAASLVDMVAPYPSWRAAMPVLGAVLLIVAGRANPRNLVARFLASRPMVGIGMVSYSWYLWHWPFLSLARIANFGELSLAMGLVLAATSFVLASATYLCLERPFRDWRRRVKLPEVSRRVVFSGMGASAVLLASAGIAGAVEDWWLTRKVEARTETTKDTTCETLYPTMPPECASGLAGLVMGDSHARAVFGVVAGHYADQKRKLALVVEGGCNPARFMLARQSGRIAAHCNHFSRLFDTLTMPSASQSGFVIVAARWNSLPIAGFSAARHEGPNLRDSLRAFLTLLVGQGRRVLLVGPTPEFSHGGIACVLLAERYGAARERCDEPRSIVDDQRVPRMRLLREVAAEFEDVHVIDPIDIFCDARACHPYDHDLIVFSDDNHLSPVGAELVYKTFTGEFAWVAGDEPAAP